MTCSRDFSHKPFKPWRDIVMTQGTLTVSEIKRISMMTRCGRYMSCWSNGRVNHSTIAFDGRRDYSDDCTSRRFSSWFISSPWELRGKVIRSVISLTKMGTNSGLEINSSRRPFHSTHEIRTMLNSCDMRHFFMRNVSEFPPFVPRDSSFPSIFRFT